MMNFKQKELVEEFWQAISDHFPDVEFMNVTESPEDPTDLWLNIAVPDDEDREIELIEFAGNRSADILIDYGYSILIMPRRTTTMKSKSPELAVQPKTRQRKTSKKLAKDVELFQPA